MSLHSGIAHLVDDYGHHPTEVLATLECKGRRTFPECLAAVGPRAHDPPLYPYAYFEFVVFLIV